ncbi:MAG: hypothetical protein IPO37_03955 [Saprospiraceae bacterium]|nr:hypothetical protein [Saprospiraceae bacterium]
MGYGDLNIEIEKNLTSGLAIGLKNLFNKENINLKLILRNNNYLKNYKVDARIDCYIKLFQLFGINLVKSWVLLLKLLKPKVVFIIDWQEEVNEACNRFGVSAIYIQHGVISADHLTFGKKKMEHTPLEKLPQAFLVWDDTSKENFKNLIHTYTIGNLYKKAIDLESTFFKEYKESLSQIHLPVVLLSLTYDNPDFVGIPKQCIKVIKRTCHKFFWVIRPHPVLLTRPIEFKQFCHEMETNFKNIANCNIEWKKYNRIPIQLIFRYTNIHITIESSTVCEAAEMNIKSLILNEKVVQYGPNGENTIPYGGPSYFKYEREKGLADVYSLNLDIEEWIINNLNQSDNQSPIQNIYEEEWEKFLEDYGQVLYQDRVIN